ncbi:hypothetical protein J6590_070863 [Homalodisca vitripennis]|nr:hypothetical protein J6590_070863 [Homalodisca vitripennis]
MSDSLRLPGLRNDSTAYGFASSIWGESFPLLALTEIEWNRSFPSPQGGINDTMPSISLHGRFKTSCLSKDKEQYLIQNGLTQPDSKYPFITNITSGLLPHAVPDRSHGHFKSYLNRMGKTRIASIARAFPTTRNTLSSAVRVGKGPAWRPQESSVFFRWTRSEKRLWKLGLFVTVRPEHPPGKETRSGPRSGRNPLTERLDKERAPRS